MGVSRHRDRAVALLALLALCGAGEQVRKPNVWSDITRTDNISGEVTTSTCISSDTSTDGTAIADVSTQPALSMCLSGMKGKRGLVLVVTGDQLDCNRGYCFFRAKVGDNSPVENARYSGRAPNRFVRADEIMPPLLEAGRRGAQTKVYVEVTLWPSRRQQFHFLVPPVPSPDRFAETVPK